MSQTEVQLIKNNAVVEADIANDAVTRDKINVVSTSSAPGIEIKGDDGSQEGYLQLNCRVNSHGVKIQSPPHSASQSYKIILPDNQIAADKFLKVKSITGSGSTATGQLEFANASGITEVDNWRITSSFNASGAGAYITSNWERNDTAGFTKIGTGLTESSGVFTFPVTGIYQITAVLHTVNNSNTNRYTECKIYTTQNNSAYTEQTTAAGEIGETYGQNMVRATAIFDCTDTSTHKFQIRQYTYNSNTQIVGSSTVNKSYIVVIRLGDT